MTASSIPYIPASFDDMGLSWGAFRVYCHLVRRANGKGEAFPSLQNIQKMCGGRRNTIVAVIKELETRGMLEVNRTSGIRNKYRLTDPSIWRPVAGQQTDQLTSIPNDTGIDLDTGTSIPNATRVVSQAQLDQYPAKSANQLPEPLEVSEGLPLRYTNKGGGGGEDSSSKTPPPPPICVAPKKTKEELPHQKDSNSRDPSSIRAELPLREKRSSPKVPGAKSVPLGNSDSPDPLALMTNEIFDQMVKDPLYAGINLYKQAEKFTKYHKAEGLPFTRQRFEHWLGKIHEVKARRQGIPPL